MNVVDEVLDADHLVVGVDLEVVLPRVGAVVGVVVRDRRPARDPVEPVVERPEAEQEADRAHRQAADEDDDVPVVDRIPAGEPADPGDEVEPDQEEQREAPGAPDEARAHQEFRAGAGRAAPWPRSWDVCSTTLTRSAPLPLHCRSLRPCREIGDEGVDLLRGERVAEVPRHHARWSSRRRSPCSGRRSTPSRTPRDPRPPSSRRRRGCRGSGRSAPFVPAGVERVAAAAAGRREHGCAVGAARRRRPAAPSPTCRSRPARRRAPARASSRGRARRARCR